MRTDIKMNINLGDISMRMVAQYRSYGYLKTIIIFMVKQLHRIQLTLIHLEMELVLLLNKMIQQKK